MTYQELVKKVQTALVKADASGITEHIAVQVNVTGEAAGAFYIEIKDGLLYVEPYDYNDRDFLLTGDGTEILAVAQGKVNLVTAIADSRVFHEGNYDKTIALGDIIPKKTRKPRASKAETAETTEKKELVEKTAEKTPAKRSRKPKTEAGKATADKSVKAKETEKVAEKTTRKTTKKTAAKAEPEKTPEIPEVKEPEKSAEETPTVSGQTITDTTESGTTGSILDLVNSVTKQFEDDAVERDLATPEEEKKSAETEKKPETKKEETASVSKSVQKSKNTRSSKSTKKSTPADAPAKKSRKSSGKSKKK
ncbi:MAG: SCP2 sterol-binding domain-containing protein [Oscillospiraceae bacterium]|nr:SCP2 sterol-binding domain-containing protein [Oscillospiraceae bacterium]